MPQVFCPKCGSEIPEGTIICPNCQFDLRDFNQEAEEELTALLNSQKVSGDGEREDSGESSQGETPSAENNIRAVRKKSAPKPEEEASGRSEEQPAKAEGVGEEEEEPTSPPAGKKKKEKKPKGKKAKEPKEKKPLPAFVITLLCVVVVAALGFCSALFFFGDLFPTAQESFAVTAANAVNSKLNVNEKLCVYKAYVKQAGTTEECILYAIIDYNDTVSVTRYRVVFDRNTPNVINIYYPVDETSQAYLDMKNSDDPQTRVQASVLKNYSDTIEAAHREILIGSPAWVEVDISKINGKITSQQTRNTGSSVAPQEKTGVSEETDIEDLEDGAGD